jgi:hypothetical protein
MKGLWRVGYGGRGKQGTVERIFLKYIPFMRRKK